jgi:opacity protein-like surface antigen
MRRIPIISIILLSLATVSAAQDHPQFFRKGSKALLFEFSGLSELGANAFNGGIGGKYFLDNKMAIRGGLQYMNLNEDIPNQGSGGIDGTRQANRFGLSAAVEIHFDTSRVNPYFGGGASFSITSTESRTAADNFLNQIIIKNDQNGEFGYYGGSQFSLFAMLGIEVFILDNLSLAAEYRFGYAYLSRKDQEITQGNTTVTTKQGSMQGIGIASSGALILAVYF